MQADRKLVLENGAVFEGKSFGYPGEVKGEVVFQTGMTGYQETLTDPSYCGQIVTFTYPLIGNYGIHRGDMESIIPAVGGCIVREHCPLPSHWKNEMTLDEWLRYHQIPGLYGIDTRRLVRILRHEGTMRGKISPIYEKTEKVASELQKEPRDSHPVERVSTKEPYAIPGRGKRIVIIDFGAKKGILRQCVEKQLDIVVMPYHTKAQHVLSAHPDGVLLTNGPGDPKDVPEAVETVRQLLGKVPLFGICLGHQLLALASGADTEKMRFGHRGANHPVREIKTGRVFLTAQNHGYAVTRRSLAGTSLNVTYENVNDHTVEGIEHRDFAAFGVQYHPEAAPGPRDTANLLTPFFHRMEGKAYA